MEQEELLGYIVVNKRGRNGHQLNLEPMEGELEVYLIFEIVFVVLYVEEVPIRTIIPA